MSEHGDELHICLCVGLPGPTHHHETGRLTGQITDQEIAGERVKKKGEILAKIGSSGGYVSVQEHESLIYSFGSWLFLTKPSFVLHCTVRGGITRLVSSV